jgi:glycosyltransferase involved in cell wall biosynthesis
VPPPVRALFLNDTSRNGGPGRTLYYILKFIDPARIHRTVVLPRKGVVSELLANGSVADEVHLMPNLVENPIEPWSRAMERRDFEAPLPLRAIRASGNVARGASALFELKSLVKKTRADVVFCNGTTANFAGGALARMAGIPVLWHAFYPSVARPIRGVHARLAAGANVRRILCVSRRVARQFAHVAGKVRVVHDAIDTSEFAPESAGSVLRRELGISDDVLVFGSQGRILPHKGYLEMVRAARFVVDRLPVTARHRVRFVVLGDTPDDRRKNHLEECRAEVVRLGLEGFFSFLGYRPDVKAYANDFSVAVVPSVYDDPLPRAVLEAMSLAKPVVAFDVGGIPEMVVNEETGLLVHGRKFDAAALAEALLRYARNPTLAQKHGEAGRLRAQREFDSASHAKTIEDELVRAARDAP